MNQNTQETEKWSL